MCEKVAYLILPIVPRDVFLRGSMYGFKELWIINPKAEGLLFQILRADGKIPLKQTSTFISECVAEDLQKRTVTWEQWIMQQMEIAQ